MQEIFASGQTAILFVFKIGIVLFLVIYSVFAATIIKQVRIMTETLTTGFEFYLKISAFLHFIFSLFVLILAIVIL